MKGHEKKHERAIAEESSIIFVHLLSCFMGIQNIHNSKSAFWCRELEMGATRLGDGALLSWAQFGHLFTLAVTRSRKMTSSWKTLCIHCWSGSVLRRLDSVESVESVKSVERWAIQWPIWRHRRMISLWSPACCQSGQPEDLTVKFHPGVTVNRDVRWL